MSLTLHTAAHIRQRNAHVPWPCNLEVDNFWSLLKKPPPNWNKNKNPKQNPKPNQPKHHHQKNTSAMLAETFHLNNSQTSASIKNPVQDINLLSQMVLEKRQAIPWQNEGPLNISLNVKSLAVWSGHTKPQCFTCSLAEESAFRHMRFTWWHHQLPKDDFSNF